MSFGGFGDHSRGHLPHPRALAIAAGGQWRAVALSGRAVATRWGALGFAIPVVALLLVMLPMFSAELGMIDDHQIPLMTGADGRVWPWEWPDAYHALTITGDDGRFRPMYYALRTTEAMLWGEWPGGWYLVRLALMAMTGVGVIWLSRPLGVLGLSAVGLLAVAGPQAESWFRLGPQEAYAAPLLVGAIIGWWGGRRSLALLLLAAAGLTKESFAAVMPLVIAWWWWRDSWRPSRTLLVGTLVALVIAAATGLTFLHGDYYGSTRSVESVISTFGIMCVWCAPAMAVVALGAVRRPRLWLAFGPILLVLAVEAVVYGGVRVEGRYLLPAVLAPLLFVPSALRAMSRPIGAGAVACLLVWACANSVLSAGTANAWVQWTHIYQAGLAEIDAYPGPLIITSPIGGTYEPAVSVARFLAGVRPTGPCAEVIFAAGTATGQCETVFLLPGAPHP